MGKEQREGYGNREGSTGGAIDNTVGGVSPFGYGSRLREMDADIA